MKRESAIFEMIAQEAIMGILAFEATERACFYANRVAREALEINEGEQDPARQEPPPTRIDDLYVFEDRPGVARGFKQDMLAHEGLYQDVLLRKRDGNLLIANVGIKHCFSEASGKIILIMFQDITLQKKLQREVQSKQNEIRKAYTELLEQNRQLLELDQSKDKFLALTTHELRTPLAAIVATAEVLALGLYESDEQRDGFIKAILEQGNHLMEIVNDILDLAKIRAGKMDFFVEQQDLFAVIAKSAANFEQMARQAEVSVNLIGSESSFFVWIDVLRFREVVDNVINNAIKYNRRGGTVTIRVEARDRFARAIVTDTGLGIPTDKVPHVFNEFETVGSVSKHHKGTGLGMPISKRLMQTMGGDVTLESEPGVGTSFFIDVPMEQVLPEEMYRPRPDIWGDLAA